VTGHVDGGPSALERPAGDVGATELRAVLRAAVAEGVRDVTLDFSGGAMVDSAGLGWLIAGHNSLRKVGGNLAVVHAAKEILDLFRSLRIRQHFSVSGE